MPGQEDMMEQEVQRLDPAELRAAARYIEEVALSALASYSEIPINVYSGSLEQFPQPSQPDMAAQNGILGLRQSIERVVSALYTLALAAENGLPVPPVLLIQLEPYLEAFRSKLVPAE
jgi:hypothetical protein